jgi:tetratricopeptide (TPR) repeat protein
MTILPIKLAATVSIALLMMATGFQLRAQLPSAPDERLSLGTSLTHEVKMGLTRRFSVEVKSGQYLRINVWHSAAHIAVRLSDSKGRTLYSSRAEQWYGDWFNSVFHIAESDGTLFFEVVPIEVKAGMAKTAVHLIELRPSGGDDQARIDALRIFNEGLSKRSGSFENVKTAEGLFIKAGQDFLSVGEYTLSAVSLVNLGWVLQELGNHRNSQQFFALAITLFSNLKDPLGESKAHAGVSYSLNALGDYKGSIAAEEKALKVKQVFGIAYEEATSYINIGLNQFLDREYRKAVESCRKGLERSRESLSQDRARRALSCLSTAQTELGNYDEALANLTEAVTLSKSMGDARGEAESLLSIAMVHATRGEYPRALSIYEETAAALRRIDDRKFEASVLKSMASLYAALNSYEKAIATLERSVAISRALGDTKELVRGLESLALYNVSLGRYGEAETMYRRAYDEYRSSGNVAGRMDVLASLGFLFSRRGDAAKSLEYYESAVALIPEVRDPKAEVRVLAGAAWALVGTMKRPMILKAREYFTRAAAREQASGTTATLPILRLGIGFTHLQLEDVPGARSAFAESAESARASGNPLAEGWANGYLADVSSMQGNSEESILFGKRAVNLFQRIRVEVRAADESLVKGFLADKVPVFRALSDRLISLGRLAEAQAVLDLLKDEEYAGLTTRTGEKAVTVPYSLSEEKAVLAVDNLASLGRRRLELEKLQNAPEGLNSEQQKELDRVYDEIEKANEAFRGSTSRSRPRA